MSDVPAAAPCDPDDGPDPAAAGAARPTPAAGGRTPEGAPLSAGEEDPEEEEPDGAHEEHPRAPWHFKVLLVGTVIYLGYRLYQGISWLAHHL